MPIDFQDLKFEANHTLGVHFRRIDAKLYFNRACDKDALNMIIEKLQTEQQRVHNMHTVSHYGLTKWNDLSGNSLAIDVPTW